MEESCGCTCHPVNASLTFPIDPVNPYVHGNWAIQIIV